MREIPVSVSVKERFVYVYTISYYYASVTLMIVSMAMPHRMDIPSTHQLTVRRA